MMTNMIPDFEKMTAAFNSIMPIFESLDTSEMLPIICTMIDTAAGREYTFYGCEDYDVDDEVAFIHRGSRVLKARYTG